MAQSPSHRFGQMICNLYEAVTRAGLQAFCAPRGLYLDVPGDRPGVRRGRKIRWTDRYGNEHDLDFVIERGGSAEKKGKPVAFIEAAWRRYTKHSRNKVQEIQGAIFCLLQRVVVGTNHFSEQSWRGSSLADQSIN